jgi:phage shock protein A
MHITLGLIIELTLTALLAVTLVYCILLERRLAAVRKGQEGLKSTIGALNSAIANAGAAMHALKTTTASAAETLDTRLTRARSVTDELSLLIGSGERIAERIDRAAEISAATRTRQVPEPSIAAMPAGVVNLPSSAIMKRLDTLRAVR